MEAQPNLKETEKKLNTKPLRSKSCLTAWCSVGLLIITWLGLLLGLSYFWIKNNEQFKSYQSQASSLQTQLLKNQVESKNLQQHISQLEDFIEQKFATNNNSILLANANQLIQLAQYNLVYFHDINNALSALTLANNQLNLIISPDIRLENLRQLLIHYLTRLKALPPIDSAAVLNQIETLKKQISQLPLLSAKNISSIPPTDTTHNASEKKWMYRLRDSLNSFRQLITIRRLNKPIEPLLPEIEQRYLQQNVHLLLQQTQWAFIHHEMAIYHTSLQEVQTTILNYFSTDSSLAKTVMQTVNQLKQIDLQASLLDFNPLLKIITAIKKNPINTAPAVTVNQKEFS